MTVAFDTLKLADRLEAAGMPAQQAKGVAAALAETATATLVSREYVFASDRNGRATMFRGAFRGVRAFKGTPWPALDEITALVERYWVARNEAENAWKALPESAQKSGGRRPPGRPKWD